MTPKRPRDPNQLAKSIIDIATGQKPDRVPRTVQRALINLAIEDAIAGEESSCTKCFP